jgi:uncharacterized membrane protein
MMAWRTLLIPAAAARRGFRLLGLSRVGLFATVLSVCLSLTPSLLPRTWMIQGIVSGLSACLGYGAGVTMSCLARRIVPQRLRRSRPRDTRIWRVVASGAVALLAFSLYRGSLWQRDLYVVMGEPAPPQMSYTGVLLVTLILLAAGVASARVLRGFARWFGRGLARFVPPWPARAGGGVIVGLLATVLVTALLQDGLLPAISEAWAGVNASPGPSAVRPTSPQRSGSPGSLVSWKSLGMQGRSFVSGGPTMAQLARFGGTSARQPIRVYVGLESAPDITAAARLAVRELERTRAFDRAVLVVVTSTGTGWVDPYVAAALEYMYNGDTATVTIQYSWLPSWVLLLTDRARVERAGRELFEQVHERWSAEPPAHRPRLLIFGESLGSLGSEAAFSGLDDLRARTDGALLAGPTNANPLWSRFVADRDPGTPEVLPVYQRGETVRFASQPADLSRPPGPWRNARVVYLQNPSDPVTWWTPGLALRRPDWLAEPPGYDVLPAMRWYPFLTFLQVTADLALAEAAPKKHGHDFRRAAAAAWAAIAPPTGWSDARTDALTGVLDGLPATTV